LSGDWDRDLTVDLEVIKSSGAKALMTLMENDELSAVQVPFTELGEKAASLGLEWHHHLPVRNDDVPDCSFEDVLTYSGLRFRDLLIQGKKVVIHCLGGMGRTGTIAARLLVEVGASPNDAIRAVRAVRTGAVQTRKQEEPHLCDHLRGNTGGGCAVTDELFDHTESRMQSDPQMSCALLQA